MNIKAHKKALKQKIDGLEVRNALQPLDLHIMEKDLRASPKDPAHCVAANCILRMPKVKNVRVHLTRTFILFGRKRHWVRYITPVSLKAELIAFDRGGDFAPGDYTLQVPKEYLPKPGSGPTTSGGNHAAKRAKRFRHMTFGVRPHA